MSADSGSNAVTDAFDAWETLGIDRLFDSNGNVIGFVAGGFSEKGSLSIAPQMGEFADGEEPEEVTERHFAGPLAILGHPTVDGRFLMPDGIGEREFPLPFNVQIKTAEGHDEALNAGRIESVKYIPVGEFAERDEFPLEGVPDEAVVVWGEGILDGSPAAQEAERLIANGYGVSLDLPHDRLLLVDPETLQEVPEDEIELQDVLAGKYLTGVEGKIAGATVVNVPAFAEAVVRLADRERGLVASGQVKVWGEVSASGLSPEMLAQAAKRLGVTANDLLSEEQIRDGARGVLTLVAAGAKGKPDSSYFENPGFMKLTPLTIGKPDANGYRPVSGHLADWDGCHSGFGNVCVPPFRSETDYAYFNVGEIECEDGTLIPIGKLMFSMDGGKHADLDPHLSAAEVSKHYDDSTKIGAYVRAGTDRFGTWLAGVLRPGLTDIEIQHLRANPPSGDWRPIPNHSTSELVAAFSVPVPGFPIARSLVASGMDGQLIVISGPMVLEEGPRERLRKKKMLRRRAWAALGR